MHTRASDRFSWMIKFSIHQTAPCRAFLFCTIRFLPSDAAARTRRDPCHVHVGLARVPTAHNLDERCPCGSRSLLRGFVWLFLGCLRCPLTMLLITVTCCTHVDFLGCSQGAVRTATLCWGRSHAPRLLPSLAALLLLPQAFPHLVANHEYPIALLASLGLPILLLCGCCFRNGCPGCKRPDDLANATAVLELAGGQTPR